MVKKLLILAPLLVAGWCYLGPSSELSGELPTERLAGEDLVATISHGEDVDLSDHLEAGKWTLFEYGAEW